MKTMSSPYELASAAACSLPLAEANLPSLPLLMTYAREHGLNPLTLGMVWTFGAGPKLFIYESAVLVVGYSYGYFGNKDMLKVGGLLSIVTAVILMLLVPLYWPLIGIGR